MLQLTYMEFYKIKAGVLQYEKNNKLIGYNFDDFCNGCKCECNNV